MRPGACARIVACARADGAARARMVACARARIVARIVARVGLHARPFVPAGGLACACPGAFAAPPSARW